MVHTKVLGLLNIYFRISRKQSFTCQPKRTHVSTEVPAFSFYGQLSTRRFIYHQCVVVGDLVVLATFPLTQIEPFRCPALPSVN